MIYVYILECKDKSYYTGITSNIGRRLLEHNSRIKGCLQKSKVPVRLVYFAEYKTRMEAAKKEREIKTWNRKRKTDLILRYKNKFILSELVYIEQSEMRW